MTKIIMRYYPEHEVPIMYKAIESQLPILDLTIHGAPHKRMHRSVIQKYHEELYDLAIRRIGHKVQVPIDHPIFLKVLFVNPSSPDTDHIYEALCMGVDRKSFPKLPALLEDDRLIQGVLLKVFYPSPPNKRDSERHTKWDMEKR